MERWIAVVTVLLGVILGCGGEVQVENKVPKQNNPPLLAFVCIEDGGPGPDGLLIQNLNDFEWREITFRVVNLTPDSDQVFERKWHNWFPESKQASEPLDSTTMFEHVKTGYPLTGFSMIQGMTIEIQEPYDAQWTGQVAECPQ